MSCEWLLSEGSIATRLLTDLSIFTSQIVIAKQEAIGFSDGSAESDEITLNYPVLASYFGSQPGLVSDQLKATLEWAWSFIQQGDHTKGLVFAYDEAQNMTDRAKDKEYPLSLLLDVFQSLQRKDIPFLLVLVGLPTLFPKLVETRTYSERMFKIVELKSLTPNESREAIMQPITKEYCPVTFNEGSIQLIVRESGGYPYFIQFICREAYDSFLSQLGRGIESPGVPVTEIVSKLDNEFFAGRWNNTTDRQRELLSIVALLDSGTKEFTIQEVAQKSNSLLSSPIGNSQINQMFTKLMEIGLMHRTRYGKYTLGIPLLGDYIKRQNIIQNS